MGRPPCCDKVGVKKGPWTPEEDIMLVSYVQEHGAGNWRAVPSNTGLRRCSKSCRLRWTNYLRPGIKRGSFTEDEEKMIIQLQALLGNKWAAIASYLPERTDNDIKNYWNTHLRKKLKKLQESPICHNNIGFSNPHSISRGQWEKKLQTDINKAKQALNDALSLDKPSPVIPELKPSKGYYSYSKQTQGFTYASSTENIARLLKGWVKRSPKIEQASSTSSEGDLTGPKTDDVDLSEAFESLFGFDSFESSNSDLSRSMSPEASIVQDESKVDVAGDQFPMSMLEATLLQDDNKTDVAGDQFPLSMFENWLFDETVMQGKEELANFSFEENAELFV